MLKRAAFLALILASASAFGDIVDDQADEVIRKSAVPVTGGYALRVQESGPIIAGIVDTSADEIIRNAAVPVAGGYALRVNGSGGGGGGGTVTSITAGSGLTGGTITTSGTIALATHTPNTAATFNGAGALQSSLFLPDGTGGSSVDLGNRQLYDSFLNPILYWGTSGKIGIGSSNPGQKLTVDGTLGILGNASHTIFQGSGSQASNITYTLPPAQGAANTVLSNNGAGVLSWAAGGGSSPSIGGTLIGATAGSILFAGSGTFAQDNADLFWDNTTKSLGIGTATPFAKFDVENTNASLLVDANNTQMYSGATSGTLLIQNVNAAGSVLTLLGSNSGALDIKVPNSGSNYSLTFPGAQGAASTVLTNNGSGVLSWSPASSSPAFPLLSPEGTYTTSGYLFTETGNDTGMTSGGDGDITFYSNSTTAVRFNQDGITEIRGVPYDWTNTQGAAGTVLTNDGSGGLSWGAPSTSGPANSFAGYDNSGNLGQIPGWAWDNSTYGLNQGNTIVPVDATNGSVHRWVTHKNPAANTTGDNWTINQFAMNLGSDDSGFSDTASTTTVVNIAGSSVNKSDFGSVEELNVSGNFGNGTDPINGDSLFMLRLQPGLANGGPVHIGSLSMLDGILNAQASSLIDNYSFVRDSAAIDTVGSYSGVELRPQIVHATNNIFGISDNITVTNADQSVFGFSFNPISTGTVTGQVKAFEAGGNLNAMNGYNGYENYMNFVSNTGGYLDINLHPTGTTSDQYTGVLVSPNIATLTGAGATGFQFNGTSNLTGTATAVGFDANMSGITNGGTGEVFSFRSNAKVQFGENVTLTSGSPGLPRFGHQIGGTYQAGPGLSLTDIDSAGVANLQFNGLDAGTTATSGGFGLGLANEVKLSFASLAAGSDLDHMNGLVIALLANGSGTDTGNLQDYTGFRLLGANVGGAETVGNVYGYRFDPPSAGGWSVTGTEYPVYANGANAVSYFEGKVGVGTNAPAYKLEVAGGDIRSSGDHQIVQESFGGTIALAGGTRVLGSGNIYLDTSGGGSINMRPGISEVMSVQSGGLVGINTSTTPTANLELVGDFKASDTGLVKIKHNGVVHFANMDTTTRDALTGLEPGDEIYNTTTNALEYWDGAAWN